MIHVHTDSLFMSQNFVHSRVISSIFETAPPRQVAHWVSFTFEDPLRAQCLPTCGKDIVLATTPYFSM